MHGIVSAVYAIAAAAFLHAVLIAQDKNFDEFMMIGLGAFFVLTAGSIVYGVRGIKDSVIVKD